MQGPGFEDISIDNIPLGAEQTKPLETSRFPDEVQLHLHTAVSAPDSRIGNSLRLLETPPTNVKPTSLPHHSNFRILSLGGDGVGILSSLRILREVMKQVCRLEAIGGTPLPPTQTPRPCDYFDLIVGTGTGAIVAIFLGRLSMTVEEAIRGCVKLMTVATSGSALHTLQTISSPFDPEKLANHFEVIVRTRLGYGFEPMGNPRGCRTLVLAARAENIDAPPAAFRSYNTTKALSSQFTIVGVMSAVCAPRGFPVSLGRPAVSYINAARFGYNNPTELAIDEAENIWGLHNIGLVLYIGTGAKEVVDVRGGRDTLAAAQDHILAGSGDPVHGLVYKKSRQAGFLYHRLQVDQVLGNVATRDWTLNSMILDTLISVTDGYLRGRETRDHVESCVQAIYGRPLPLVMTRRSFYPGDSRQQLQAGSSGLVMRSGTDDNGFIPYTRNDIRLIEKLIYHLDYSAVVRPILYKAELPRDGRIVLVKVYPGSSLTPLTLNKEAFSQDYGVHTQTWDDSVLQLFGVSNTTNTLPFQVYHQPSGQFDGFFHWLWHTWYHNPVEVFLGLYDMRLSLQALSEFIREQRQQGIDITSFRHIFFKSVVQMRSDGPKKTLYTVATCGMKDIRTLKEMCTRTINSSLTAASFDVTARIPPPVAAFCATSEEWFNDVRPLEQVANRNLNDINIAELAYILFENGWLRESSTFIRSRHNVGLGDVGRLRGSYPSEFEVMANRHDAISKGGKIFGRFISRSTGEKPFCESVLGKSGQLYMRTVLFSKDGVFDPKSSCYNFSFEVQLQYQKEGLQHAWKVLQRDASQVGQLQSQNIPPHDLLLVTSVRKLCRLLLNQEESGGDTGVPDPESKDTTPPPVYIFVVADGMDVRHLGALDISGTVAASFDPSPEWLHDDIWYDKRIRERRDGYTLGEIHHLPNLSNTPGWLRHEISFIQLPIGVASTSTMGNIFGNAL